MPHTYQQRVQAQARTRRTRQRQAVVAALALGVTLVAAPLVHAQETEQPDPSEEARYVTKSSPMMASLTAQQFGQAQAFENAEWSRLEGKWLAMLDHMPTEGAGPALTSGKLREAIKAHDVYAAALMAISDSEGSHSTSLMYQGLISVMADDTADLGRELLVTMGEDGVAPAKIAKAHDGINIWLGTYGKLIYGYGTDGQAAKTFAQAGAHRPGEVPPPAAKVESNGSARGSDGVVTTPQDVHLQGQNAPDAASPPTLHVVQANPSQSPAGVPSEVGQTGQAGQSPIGQGAGVSYSSGGDGAASTPDRPLLYATTSTNGVSDFIPAMVNGRWQLVNNPASARWSEGVQGYNGQGAGGGQPIGYLIDGDQVDDDSGLQADLDRIKAQLATEITGQPQSGADTGVSFAQIYDGYVVTPGQGGSTVMQVTSTQVNTPTSVMTVPSTQVDVPSTQVNTPSPVMTSLDLYPSLCGL